MSEEITEKWLNEIGGMVELEMTPSLSTTLPQREPTWEEDKILKLIEEVRRLRSEAIVWHPWPGEEPPRSDVYLVEVLWSGGLSSFGLYKWDGGNTHSPWGVSKGSKVVAWQVLPEPYGGV